MRVHNLLPLLAPAVYGQDLMTALSDQPMLSNLTTYLSLFPSLMSSISKMSNVTLLAPSNMAFEAALGSSTASAFSANDTQAITALLEYHVLNGTYSNFSMMPQFVPTALMSGMYANVSNGQVVEAIGSNGTNTTFFSGLLSNSTSSNMTNFTSGVIYTIDRFLTLPTNISDTAVQLNLRSAVGALEVAGLADAVDALQNVTCFVPDNAAFQAIGSALATTSKSDLSRILEYHVVNGSVLYSPSIMNGSNVTSMNGLEITITTEMENGTEVIFVNSARVLTPNVLVANGVVHVIDNVLNPGNRTAKADTSATSDAPAFSGASSVSEEPFTSGVASATTTVETGGAQSVASSAASGASSSSSGGAMPMATGDIGAAALFGAAVLLNL